jgi:hypothetical protein
MMEILVCKSFTFKLFSKSSSDLVNKLVKLAVLARAPLSADSLEITVVDKLAEARYVSKTVTITVRLLPVDDNPADSIVVNEFTEFLDCRLMKGVLLLGLSW